MHVRVLFRNDSARSYTVVPIIRYILLHVNNYISYIHRNGTLVVVFLNLLFATVICHISYKRRQFQWDQSYLLQSEPIPGFSVVPFRPPSVPQGYYLPLFAHYKNISTPLPGVVTICTILKQYLPLAALQFIRATMQRGEGESKNSLSCTRHTCTARASK